MSSPKLGSCPPGLVFKALEQKLSTEAFKGLLKAPKRPLKGFLTASRMRLKGVSKALTGLLKAF